MILGKWMNGPDLLFAGSCKVNRRVTGVVGEAQMAGDSEVEAARQPCSLNSLRLPIGRAAADPQPGSSQLMTQQGKVPVLAGLARYW
jgi:hypothetical protein